MAAQRGNVFCQPAGDHQRSRLTQFFFDALHHAVNEHRRTHHRAGKHAFFGIGADGALGRTQMHLRQLAQRSPSARSPVESPGQITPPRNTRSLSTTLKVVAVPRSTVTTGSGKFAAA